MKHLKHFESVNDNFIFAVDITNITTEQVYQLKDKILSEFPDYNKYGDYNFDELFIQIKVPQFKYNKPWALIFNVYDYFYEKRVAINKVVTPGWGAGYEYMEAIVPLNEFLKIDFSELKEYIDELMNEIEMKKNTDKYNL